MRLTIDLSKKGDGYRKAFEEYLERNKARGMFFEFGAPDFKEYVHRPVEDAVHRLYSIDDNRVCATGTNIVIDNDIVYIDIKPFGAFKEALEGMNDVTFSTRMVLGHNPEKGDYSYVNQVAGLDIIPAGDSIADPAIISKLMS